MDSTHAAVLRAESATVEMCGDHDKFSDIWMPRSLTRLEGPSGIFDA